MGLTPKLAMADGNRRHPLRPGPAASTRSDEPDPSASESPKATPTPSATPTDDAGQGRGAGSGRRRHAEAHGERHGHRGPGGRREARHGRREACREARRASRAPPRRPTKSKNPLDPLGLGDALKDLFDPDKGKDEAEASPRRRRARPRAPRPTPRSRPTSRRLRRRTRRRARRRTPSRDASDQAKEAADGTADAIREAAEKAGKDVKELDDDVKGLDPKKDEDIPDGAKPRFPCPDPDPKALAAAALEPGIPLLPDDPWILESSLLTLNGLDYKGIVEVKTADGTIKKVLKFTAERHRHQGPAPARSARRHDRPRAGAQGSTSTIRNGTVTMYTESSRATSSA